MTTEPETLLELLTKSSREMELFNELLSYSSTKVPRTIKDMPNISENASRAFINATTGHPNVPK